MELVDGTSGVSLLKIIRDESIGNYAWDNKGSTGINDWSKARLMMTLNPGYETVLDSELYATEASLYYNAKKGICYTDLYNTTVPCDFTEIGLKDTISRDLIETVIWNLGASSGIANSSNDFYNLERGTSVLEERPINWSGKVGLMYVSDYGYATSGSSEIKRNECINVNLESWANLNDCYLNNWLYFENFQWTLTPNLNHNNRVFSIGKDGNIYESSTHNAGIAVFPSLYLKSSIKIISGTGSSENPYKLSIN